MGYPQAPQLLGLEKDATKWAEEYGQAFIDNIYLSYAQTSIEGRDFKWPGGVNLPARAKDF
jgi:hypothetical protein